MNILDQGKMPLLLARRKYLGEHVDDHQEQIYRYLIERGLAMDAQIAFADPAMLATVASTEVRESLPEAA